mmetsp:Transcript_15664/g.52869  ORF Transcript_15664/g.52869 Transcript_15664/m.52869 type:complete len:239 (+) Transcript_15664:663-1379(+)
MPVQSQGHRACSPPADRPHMPLRVATSVLLCAHCAFPCPGLIGKRAPSRARAGRAGLEQGGGHRDGPQGGAEGGHRGPSPPRGEARRRLLATPPSAAVGLRLGGDHHLERVHPRDELLGRGGAEAVGLVHRAELEQELVARHGLRDAHILDVAHKELLGHGVLVLFLRLAPAERVPPKVEVALVRSRKLQARVRRLLHEVPLGVIHHPALQVPAPLALRRRARRGPRHTLQLGIHLVC